MTNYGSGGTMVLAGIDFSDGALAALREAQALSARLRLVLRLVHVRDAEAAEPVADGPAREWLAAARLDAGCLRIRRGQPWIELAREATETGAAVVVVGSHGRTGMHPLSLGSTATRLGLISPCPLVVVGPRTSTIRPDVHRGSTFRPHPHSQRG